MREMQVRYVNYTSVKSSCYKVVQYYLAVDYSKLKIHTINSKTTARKRTYRQNKQKTKSKFESNHINNTKCI